MRRVASYCVVSAIILSATAARAEPLRLSVEDAVTRALKANLDIQASRKDISVAEANLERSRPLLPSNPYFSAGAQHSDGFAPNYSFSLSQEFEVAGQRQTRINAAQKEVEKATWDVKSAEQTLVATTKTAFIHVLISIDRVTAAHRGVDAATDLMRHIEADREPSDTQRIELNEARIQVARNLRAVAWAEYTRESALGALRSLLGLPPDQALVLEGAPQTKIRQLPTDTELTARALDRRADLIALRHAAEHADLRLQVTRRESIPNVTVSGTFIRFESTNMAGGDVSVPLPIFQRKTPDLHETLAEYDRLRLQVQQLEREITKEVLEARHGCTLTAGDLQAHQEQIVPMSEENLAIERRMYEHGKVDAGDVTSRQIDLLTVRQEYLDALEAYNNALIELERVSGGNAAGE